LTTVHVERLTADLCGHARPTHFDGVTTVVAKLFAIAAPCRAYFGRKDAQQLAVITRMATDMNFAVEVVGCPLVREPDGLAMSSRNAYLTAEQRNAARVLSRALTAATQAVANGERSGRTIAALVADMVATEPLVELEYVEVRDAKELTPVERLDGSVLLALAARVGATRLIDNVELTVGTGAELCNAR
jgi:pantoate--beta-alanine ligase